MKKQVHSLWYLGALVLFLSAALSLNAQQTQPPSQPDPQTQQAPQQAQPDQSGKQAPDANAQSSQTAGAQSFTGTIVKSGDKWMFQDAASGNTYDIDHQDQVQKFEGKRVTVHGTLDASAKMIHLQ
jgi:uncharacterized protein YdeI (BOF family)